MGVILKFYWSALYRVRLTHWGRVTHICVGNLTIIGSDNGLSPSQRQAVIWINARILLIGPLGKKFSEILIGIQTFSLKKIAFENVVCKIMSMSSRPQWVKKKLLCIKHDLIDDPLHCLSMHHSDSMSEVAYYHSHNITHVLNFINYPVIEDVNSWK